MMFHDVPISPSFSVHQMSLGYLGSNGCSKRFVCSNRDPASFPSESLDPSDKVSIRACVEKWMGCYRWRCAEKSDFNTLQTRTSLNIIAHN